LAFTPRLNLSCIAHDAGFLSSRSARELSLRCSFGDGGIRGRGTLASGYSLRRFLLRQLLAFGELPVDGLPWLAVSGGIEMLRTAAVSTRPILDAR
jgi:hypothetical protein